MGTPDKSSTHLADLLSPKQIIPDLEGGDPEAAITEMVDHLVTKELLSNELRNESIDALLEREERTSTGIGAGVAIPHAFLETIEEVVAVFGRSKKGIDFESIDNSSVEFVVLFLVPKDEFQLHLKTLASIAKLFQEAEIREELREAENEEEILDAFGRSV